MELEIILLIRTYRKGKKLLGSAFILNVFLLISNIRIID